MSGDLFQTAAPIPFKDGAAYERYMGLWSRLAGEGFLDWLRPQAGLRWLDVGCGNGAFTELIAARCGPASLAGIDPSEAQLAFARTRPGLQAGDFRKGDAMALPFPDDAFDAAVMPLVIFFVPEPAQGVAEMARVVRPGGTVTAYSWDMPGGGFPYAILQQEMRAIGVPPLSPPHPEASSLAASQALWKQAGLKVVETEEIIVTRSFADLNDFWETVLGGPSVAAKLASLDSEQTADLKARLRSRLPQDAAGRITYTARANAVKGTV